MRDGLEKDYNDYINFLLENGANKDIVNLEEIKHIILMLMEWANPTALKQGKTPVAYYKPNKDGTFKIGGRTTGLKINIKYIMKYCKENDADHFIKLVRKENKTIIRSQEHPDEVPYNVRDITEITINRQGEVSHYNHLRKRKIF